MDIVRIKEPKHWWEWIRENVNVDEKILDIGIGDGNTWKMGKNGKHNIIGTDKQYNVTGFDLDGIVLPYELVRGNVCDGLPFRDKAFDVSVLSNILEHVPCIQKAIDEAMRVSRRVIIVVPLGEQKELEEKGDEMALSNPWIKYSDFISDNIFTHHRHISVFNGFDDLKPYLLNYRIVKVEIMEYDSGLQLGVVIE